MSILKPPVNKQDHIQGPPDALVTLVEYGDFQCPHCGAAHPIIQKIQKSFGKKMRFVFRHFPLSNSHEYAFTAAVAAEAASKQNKFWEMHDMLFERQAEFSENAFVVFGNDLGLNLHQFKKDLTDETLSERVQMDFESGMRSGVNGTPSFYINEHKYNGSYDFDSMHQEIAEKIQKSLV